MRPSRARKQRAAAAALAATAAFAPAAGAAKKPRAPLTMAAAQREASNILNQLRYVVDDLPATAAIHKKQRLGKSRVKVSYSLTFADGERFESTAVVRRQRDKEIGFKLLEDLPVRF